MEVEMRADSNLERFGSGLKRWIGSGSKRPIQLRPKTL